MEMDNTIIPFYLYVYTFVFDRNIVHYKFLRSQKKKTCKASRGQAQAVPQLRVGPRFGLYIFEALNQATTEKVRVPRSIRVPSEARTTVVNRTSDEEI